MPKDDAAARREKAKRLHQEVEEIKEQGTPAPPAGTSESPAAFVRRRMAEKEAKAKGGKQRD
jgi:hypothetical protein